MFVLLFCWFLLLNAVIAAEASSVKLTSELQIDADVLH